MRGAFEGEVTVSREEGVVAENGIEAAVEMQIEKR